MRLILTVTFLFSLLSFSLSQNVTKTFGGTQSDKGEVIIECANNDIILGGITNSFGAGGEDIVLTRLTPDGQVIWFKTYGSAGDENGDPMTIVEANNGDIICSFRTLSFAQPRSSIIMRLSSNGTIIWQKKVGAVGGTFEWSRGVFEHDDGSIYFGSSLDNSTFGASDGMLTKLDANGNIIWSKIIGVGQNDHIWSLTKLPNNEIILNMNSQQLGPGTRAAVLVRMDATGTILNQIAFGGTGQDFMSDIRYEPEVGYIVTGSTTSYGQGGNDAFIAKFDSLFNLKWHKTYGGPNYDIGVTAEIVNNNHYVMYMNSDLTNPTDKQMSIVGLDSNGVTLYTKSVGDEFDQKVNQNSSQSLFYSQSQDKTFLTNNYSNAGSSKMLFLTFDGNPSNYCNDTTISEAIHTPTVTPVTFSIGNGGVATNVNFLSNTIPFPFEQNICSCPFTAPNIPDTSICNGAPLQYNLDTTFNYQWLPATAFSCSTCPNPEFIGTSTTFVTVIIEKDGCTRVSNFLITIIPDGNDPTGTAPPDLTVQCTAAVPAPDIALITDEADDCAINPIVTHVGDVSDGNNCPEVITRTYNIADDSGNSIDVTQLITVNDDINPTGTAPADLSLQCAANLPVADITSITDEADNCTANPTVTHIGDVSDGNNCPEVITRTYNIADDCGNNIDLIQTITINDDILPTGTAPVNIAVQCIADVPLADITSITDEADNCTANPIVTHVGDVSNGNTCPEVITRTYNIADDCGNNIDVVQTITINDDINPTGTAPNNLLVQCIGDVPLADVALITDEVDNCTANPLVIHVGDVSDGNTCPEIITRTYRIIDDCNNNTDLIQTITINDDILPTGTTPADLVLQCFADVPVQDINAITDEADNCTVNPTVTHVGDVSDGNTCPEIITRTYNIADNCGNNIDVTQVFTINDDTNPTGTAPANSVLQCIADLPIANINLITDAADNCTTNPIVTHVGDVSDGNTCPEIITRTYNIADDCGNNIDMTQIFTINDDINPTGTLPNLNLQCIGDVPAVDINSITNEADNCTANPVVTFVSEASDGNTCPEVITRIYNIADDCGNNIDIVQTITINDDINPTGTAPTNLLVQCIGDVPPADINLITDEADNCTVNPIVTHVGDVSNGNTCPEIITRTYNIADDCGNNIDVVQTITINDDLNPTGSAPVNILVQCIVNVPPADINLITDEADNCAVNPLITHVGDVSNGNTCPEIITRTYNIADDCGNNINVIQTITINDDILPTASNPASITVQCLTDVPVVNTAVVVDEADNCTVTPTVTFVSETTDGNNCNGEIISRIYSVTDDCGNSINVTHTILVDSYTPIFTVSGAGPNSCDGTDGIITLSGLVPNTNYTMSYDGGTTNLITTNAAGEFLITGLPAGSYTNYTVSDEDCPACTTTENVSINLNDPTSAPIDAGIDLELCEGTTTTLNAINPGGANLSWNNGVTDGVAFIPPVGTTFYTITAERVNCFSSDQMVITVSPAITDITTPAGLTAICSVLEQPAYADFDAFITAGGSATIPMGGIIDSTSFILFSEVSDGNTCPETVTRTYQIADTCGVTVNATQLIVINDIINPTGTAPADFAVQCIGDVPVPDITTITDEADNCTANPIVTHVSDVSNGNTCPEIITRTYNIADACGNNIDVTQTFTINDDINPTGTAPAAVLVQCIGDVPVPNIALITDEADNSTVNPIVTHISDISDNNTCPEVITRTYNIADDCGNNINVTQIITVNDDINPTGTAAPIAVQCIGDVPLPDITVITDEADNCTVSPLISHVNDVSDGNTCPEIITRTYTIADDCGNNIDITQIITVNDDTNPTGTPPADITVQCIGDVPAVDITSITDEADNCTANPIVTHLSDVSNGNTCPEIITRTYNIADDCGNNIDVIQTITVNDDINPTGTAPAAVLVQCIGDVPAADITLIIDEADNCTVTPIVTHVGDVSDGNTCPEIITRTYNIADDCGNNIDIIQTITINDDIDPTGTAPGPISVQCIGDVPAADISLITDEADNCTVNPIVTHTSDVSDGNTCPEVITRTYNIADDCGNNIDVTQTFTINDDIDPTATDPASAIVQCLGDIPAPDPAVITDAADNCTVNPTIVFESDVSDGNTCAGEIITRTYSVTDACGNSIDLTQTFTIDLFSPVFNVTGTNTTSCLFGDGTITLSGLNPLANYEIGYNGGATVLITTNALGDYIITGLSAGTYTNFVVTEANCLACSTTNNTIVTLLDPDPPFISAGLAIELCEDETITLTAVNPENAVILWDNGVIDGVGFIQPVGTVLYTVTGTSILGCVETDQVEVTVYPKPDVAFEADFTEGCVGDEINLSSLTSGNGNECRFTINGGAVINGCNINEVFTTSGCYTINLEVETVNGCIDELTLIDYICIEDYPVANFTFTPDELSSFAKEAEFTNTSTGATTYEWNFGDGSFSTDSDPIHIYNIDEEITEISFDIELFAFSNLGCMDSITKTLTYIEDLIYYVPNTFTPDGNQYNETFKPIFTSGFDPLNYKLQIYNRWGELIFESNNAEIGWDGTYGTKQTGIVQEGVYVWKIGFKTLRNDERIVEVGSVNLLR